MGTRVVRRLARLGIAGVVVLVLTGCPEDAADIVEVKATSLDFDVAPLPGASLLSGSVSIDRLNLVAFDTTVSDAFGRGTDKFPGRDGSDNFTFGPPLSLTQDGRAPTLTHTGTVTSTSAGLQWRPPVNGPFGAQPDPEGHWWFIISGALEGLPASTTYTLALIRYGTQVNAELDQAAILQGLPVTQPDSLVVLSPNLGGDVTFVVGAGTVPSNPDTLPTGAISDANPWILGQGTTDASGNADFGFILPSRDSLGNVVYETDAAAAPSDPNLIPPGNNDNTPFGLPRYNYLVMFQGVGVGGPQIVRWQIAQDLDLSGQPLNNGFYPTPQTAFTTAELIAAPGGAGTPDSVTIELFNAEPLAGGNVWQAWLVNRDESPVTMAAATATYQRVAIVREIDPITGEVISATDSVLESAAGVSTFAGQLSTDVAGTEQEIKHRLTITDATVGGGSGPGFFTDVVFTQETGPATMPSNSRSVWFQYTDQGGTPTDFFDDASAGGSLLFGHFVPDDPAASRTFTPLEWAQATGKGGVREAEVSVEIRNLPLPPIGYYYEGWLVGPNGNAVSLGPIKTLPPDTTSLFDADIDPNLPGVTATGIRFANTSAVLDPDAIVSADETVNLTNFFLTLEPKLGGAAKNVADLETGLLPTATIISRRRTP